ncbi:MAG: hypothetical protein PHT59_04510 [Candidatus Omnitrophica bacterium]|nr:hypothetical protein [Candidatus Omnitrophota bacterium]
MGNKPIFMTSDVEKAAKIKKDEEYQKARDLSDMQKLLKLPEFRRFLWKVWEKTGLTRNPFSTNALEMGRACGIQAVGQEILADVNDADVYAFAQIQRDHISERKSKEAAEKKEEEKQNA